MGARSCIRFFPIAYAIAYVYWYRCRGAAAEFPASSLLDAGLDSDDSTASTAFQGPGIVAEAPTTDAGTSPESPLSSSEPGNADVEDGSQSSTTLTEDLMTDAASSAQPTLFTLPTGESVGSPASTTASSRYPSGGHSSTLNGLLTLHFHKPRDAENYPLTLADQLLRGFKYTADAIRGPKPLPEAIAQALQAGNPNEVLSALHLAGVVHIGPPQVEHHILTIAGYRGELKWWMPGEETPKPSPGNIFRRAQRFLSRKLGTSSRARVRRRLWNACSEAKTQLEEQPFSELESWLRVEKMAHTVLEASIVGLFGLCKPYFRVEQGSSFDCNALDSKRAILEPGLYVPLTEVAKVPAGDQPPAELRCNADSSLDRAIALDAIASPFTKSMADPTAQMLAFIPVGTPYSTSSLDKVSPPWHILLGGTYYENPAADILERLKAFEEVVNALPISFEELAHHSKQLFFELCIKEPAHARWLLGEEGGRQRPKAAAALGSAIVNLLAVLESITGPKKQETNDWKRVEEIVRKLEEGTATSKQMKILDNYMKYYAGYIEEKVLSSLVPVSARAMALLFVGLWAKHATTFSFSNHQPRAKTRLLLRLLLNERGPTKEAANVLRSAVSHLKKPPTILVGSVVRIVSFNAGGAEKLLFANARGLQSPRISMSERSLLKAMREIALKNGDLLAPLKAAASVLNVIHKAKVQDPSLKAGVIDPGLLKTRFAAEIHCYSIEQEVTRYLASRSGRQLLRDQKIALLKGIVGTIRQSTADPPAAVELRCAFSTDETAMERVLKAAASSAGVLREAGRFIRGLGRRFFRFLRRPLGRPSAEREILSELSLFKQEFVARRQDRDDWSRLAEFGTGLPFPLMKQKQKYDNPELSLEAPLDLHGLNGVGEQVVVAVDFDDTMVSSGGWKIRGLGVYLGGVDSSYPRGMAYPGVGALIYMLSMGSRRRIDGKLRPLSSKVLPVVLTSARPSVRIGFRPKRIYRHIAATYAREALLLGATSQQPQHEVTYENKLPLLTAIISGKKGRGMSKLTSLLKMLRDGAKVRPAEGELFNSETKLLFVGDSYEKDLVAGIALGIAAPNSYISTFMHIVHAEDPKATVASIPKTFLKVPQDQIELPKGALPFKIPVAGAKPAGGAGNFITGVSLSFNVILPPAEYRRLPKSRDGVNPAEKLPCEALEPRTVWKVAEEVDPVIRQIWAAHSHRWLHTGLHELLQAKKLPPPPVFVHCDGVMMGNGKLNLRYSPREGEEVLNLAALGKPIIPYTTTLGAMVTARALGMVDNQDLADFAVLIGRSERALLAPSHQPQLRAAQALTYDGEFAASLFPIPTSSLLAYDKLRRLAIWSPLGQRYDEKRCSSSFRSSVRKTMGSSKYSEDEIEKASRDALGIFHDSVCAVRDTLSNVCVAAQQEIEQAAAILAKMSEHLVVKEKDCAVTTVSNLYRPQPMLESPLIKFLSELCKSKPNQCATLVTFLEDLAALAEFRDGGEAKEDSRRFLSSAGLWLFSNPNLLLDYAKSYQKLALPFVEKSTTTLPNWESIETWTPIARDMRILADCFVPHFKAVLQGASVPPQSFFQPDVSRIKTFDRAIHKLSPLKAPTAHNWLHVAPQAMSN